ncbi:MAG: transcriptional repressor LexA [Oscillospiraceae bacterium]
MLNEKATAIYEFIRDSIDSGYPPTVREICDALGIKSTSTVHKYINLLVDEGYLEKSDNHNRAIKLSGKSGISVPLVGNVAAGQPIFAIENITEYINFNTEKTYSNPLFALKVKGDSMINAGIFTDDIIIAEQTSYAENGDLVVALVDDEGATVKTFYKENGHYRLQPENDNMSPIISGNVKIMGKVVALIRYF